MPDSIYLAMTAAEIYHATALPPKLAYMACHFSSYGTGLSNIPTKLPEGSILILNDRIPICGHDEELIAQQLLSSCNSFSCPRILLDLQRQSAAYAKLIDVLWTKLSNKLIVPAPYAERLHCPVFLPPLPVGHSLRNHIAPWKDRELWLDINYETVKITVTEDGSQRETFSYEPHSELPLQNDTLHCSYSVSVKSDRAEFLLSRNASQIASLIHEGKSLGISHYIGLYQQLYKEPRE